MKKKLLITGMLVFAVLWSTHASAQPCRRMAGAMNAPQEDWGCPIWQSLAPEQQTAINSLREDFIKKTSAIQNKVHKKRLEMDILLLDAEQDAKKLMGLQKEISALQATLDEELLDYQIKARKELTPEQIAQLPPAAFRDWETCAEDPAEAEEPASAAAWAAACRHADAPAAGGDKPPAAAYMLG